jgi:HEPN domain-containing protein
MYNTNINEDLNKELCDNSCKCSPWTENPFKLWSLMEILQVYAEAFIALGRLFEQHLISLKFNQCLPEIEVSKGAEDLIRVLKMTSAHCAKLNLPISEALWSKAIQNPPQSHRELELLIDAVNAEIKSQLFFFIPSYRAKYYDWKLIKKLESSVFPGINLFPDTSKELIRASKCYTKGEYTACVFHSMRAAEIGLRALATHLEVEFPYSITLVEWQNIIEKIEKLIKAKAQLPKGEAKDEELKFYSEAASQFRYLKDAYRIFVAHARASYDEEEALSIMQRVGEFIVSLATKLKEDSVSP